MSAFIRVLCVLLVGGLVAACGKKEPPASAKAVKTAKKKAPAKPKEPEPAILAAVGGDAAAVFKARCSTCHGIAGLGNGAAAAGLNPKPRSFADPAWQASVTDDHIRKVIVGGGTAVGKSALMTANPDLADNKAVLDGLVKIVRSLKK